MPSAKQLIELLQKIDPNADGLETLCQLINKISKTKDSVKIEVNYGKGEFEWKVTRGNMTANEFIPSNNNK